MKIHMEELKNFALWLRAQAAANRSLTDTSLTNFENLIRRIEKSEEPKIVFRIGPSNNINEKEITWKKIRKYLWCATKVIVPFLVLVLAMTFIISTGLRIFFSWSLKF